MTPTLDELRLSFVRLLTPAPASTESPEPHETSSGVGRIPEPAEVPGPVAMTPSTVATATPSSKTAGTPPTPPPPVPSCRVVDEKAKGCYFEAFVTAGLLVPSARLLDSLGFALDCVTGIDWLVSGEMEVVYDFYHPLSPIHAVVRCRVARDHAEVPTISGVYPGANWHEREAHDFFGIRFAGHPDLSPFLLPEDATYHPLRKDFAGVA